MTTLTLDQLYEKVTDKLREEIVKETERIVMHNVLMDYIKAHAGQKISKRIATFFQGKYPDNVVYYGAEYGMYHVKVWGNGIDYGQRVEFLIGYASEPYYNAEKFDTRYDGCYGYAARERNAVREQLLDSKDRTLRNTVVLAMDLAAAKEEYKNALNAIKFSVSYDVSAVLEKELGKL